MGEFAVVEFEKIKSNLTEVDEVMEISGDQKYLLDIVLVIEGSLPPKSIRFRDPGKQGHARWLTLASRICRLYISEPEPTEALIEMTTYIVNVYAPIWFTIKRNNKIHFAARSFLRLVKLTRYLTGQ